MISKNKIKYIRSLEHKKNRDAQGVFVAEGPKVVGDILQRYPSDATLIAATEDWLAANKSLLHDGCECITVTQSELAKISFLCNPQQVLAVFRKNTRQKDVSAMDVDKKLLLALDGVQDPGNLGTIIRIADWFGIENVVCSQDTADIYNPKVVQATMGSIARVNVSYMSLESFFDALPSATPIYGTLLEGNNIYDEQITRNGVVIMGNEGKGISSNVRKYITKALRIPNYPKDRETADSLNVAVATAIICAEFRRQS